jgi:formylglycine-generating enzyme required for sulfatase activity
MTPDDLLIRLMDSLTPMPPHYDPLPAFFAALQPQIAALLSLPDAERAALRDRWLPRMLQPDHEPDPFRRALIGRAIGLCGLDNRPGIGLGTDGLPEVDWVTIPAGEFIYRDDQRLTLPQYRIGRCHVTAAQFGAFLEADDGWHDPRWWDGLADHADRRRVQSAPPVQGFPIANHPFDGACWYDQIAFCRWWSHRLGGPTDPDQVMAWPVRLPTAQEWEKAARGEDGRIYPWGNTWVSGWANFDETDRFGYIQVETGVSGRVGPYFYEGTTAVGIFPQGASPYGVLDMIGNVWDHMLTLYRGEGIDLSDYYPRVICGGTWYVAENYCKATSRAMHQPHVRFFDYGFRVCSSV